MELQAEREGAGPPIVLVHGFTQTGRCWGPEATDLAADHAVTRVDAPGHGRSHGVTADLIAGAGMIADVGGPATYLGYSMGARFCLHVALCHPERVRGLVLIGGTAGIEDDAERAERHAQDLRTAQRIADAGLPAFLDAWIAQPLFAGLPSDRRFRAERLTNTVDGLRGSLEHAGTGAQSPSWDALAGLTMPVLAIAGAQDSKFAALAERMAAMIGANARCALVPDAGHAAHLEQPDAFLAILRPWLARHDL
jgi:2-succinyl-6-hydroxy-2,4-cyclohexadiene-1-carboxylate synthase